MPFLSFSTSQPRARRIFTGLMTCFAVPFGTAAASWRLKGQLDLTADLFKIAIFVALVVAVLSFLSWTIFARSKLTKMRGVLAGFFTSALTIPAPFAISGFKQAFLNSYQNESKGLFRSAFDASLNALDKGAYIFVDMTKMSLVAVIAAMCVGCLVAWWFPKETREKLT